MAAPKKKIQISVYLDAALMQALSAHAARREQSMSLIAEAAIASFLSPDADERREAAIAKRLDQQDRRLARLERDVGIAVETLALFIRFWLTTTPPLPEPAAKAARAQAGSRYDNFVAMSLHLSMRARRNSGFWNRTKRRPRSKQAVTRRC